MTKISLPKFRLYDLYFSRCAKNNNKYGSNCIITTFYYFEPHLLAKADSQTFYKENFTRKHLFLKFFLYSLYGITNNEPHLTNKKSISKFSSFVIENSMGNSMRPFSSHENDSTKKYSHICRQFLSSLIQTSNFKLVFLES